MTELRFSRDGSIRSEQSAGQTYIVGYAARHNVLSRVLNDRQGSFRERIRPGAFARAVRERHDVKMLVNHDPSLIVGRVKNATLELREDSLGLRFRCLMPDTSSGRDLLSSLRRGDLDECSFSFRNPTDRWTTENGVQVRELIDVGELLDCSVVTYPAYPATTAGVDETQRIRTMFPTGVPNSFPAEIRSRVEDLLARPEKLSDEEWLMRAKARARANRVLMD